LYEAFVEIESVHNPDDDEHENEDEINISIPTTVQINCDFVHEFSVSMMFIYLFC